MHDYISGVKRVKRAEPNGTKWNRMEPKLAEPNLSKQTELNEAEPNRTERKSLIQFME
jgi:hypothetical protein